METIGLRFFNVFGPRQDPDGAYAAVIPKWISAMIRNEMVSINGDGETSRDFCYIENVTQANVLAATTLRRDAVNHGLQRWPKCKNDFEPVTAVTLGGPPAALPAPPKI